MASLMIRPRVGCRYVAATDVAKLEPGITYAKAHPIPNGCRGLASISRKAKEFDQARQELTQDEGWRPVFQSHDYFSPGGT